MPVFGKGSTGEKVVRIQMALKAAGFFENSLETLKTALNPMPGPFGFAVDADRKLLIDVLQNFQVLNRVEAQALVFLLQKEIH